VTLFIPLNFPENITHQGHYCKHFRLMQHITKQVKEIALFTLQNEIDNHRISVLA
jgi:hypothetical protein